MKDEDEDDRKAGSFREYLENARDYVKVFRWLWKEVITSQSKKLVRTMLGYTVAVTLLSAAQPFALAQVFTGLANRDSSKIVWGMVWFATLLGALKCLDRRSERARELACGVNWHRLDDRITELFFGKSIAQHVQEGTRLSAASINKGRWRVIDMQTVLLFEGVPTLAQLLIYLAFLICLSRVGGLLMTLLFLIYLVWSMYLNYRVTRVCTPIESDWRKLNKRRDERWEKVERVIVNGHEGLETEEMSATFKDVVGRDCAFWLWFIDNATIRSFVNLACLSACMSWGIWLVWIGEWKIGLLYSLFALSNQVSQNVWKLGEIERKISWNMPSVTLMIDSLSIPPSIVDKPNAIALDHTVPHRIVCEEVSHTYQAETKGDTEQPAALIRVTLSIEKGEKVAVIGPSGAGKSTLMKMLLRFDDPTSGHIRIGGTNLSDISIASYRRGVGYIPQTSQIFDGTIRSNLVYGLTAEEREKVSDDELWALMKLLQIDFGNRLTDGLDTKVGKSGLKLSGGQAQRLMIGAAVIKKPWLLVVDEATASLDSTTEKLVQEGLAKVLSGNTSALIVAHRLSTVRRLCTKFVVLRPAEEVKDGESQVEAIAGSFEELYQISPTFRRLADDQGVTIGSRIPELVA